MVNQADDQRAEELNDIRLELAALALRPDAFDAGTKRRLAMTAPNRLGVTVTNGVVDLWGYAQSNEQRKAIRVAAEDIPGVTMVNDHLADSSTIVY
jgi:hypothetical protein